MKGLILSGGKGTRLRPLTYTGAKQLVPIANKPVLFYAIEDLVEAGVTEIGIVVGDTAEQIKTAVGDGARFGARVTYIPQSAPMGLAHAVKIARDFLGDERFVLFLGDNFIRDGIIAQVETFRRGGMNCQIILYKVPNREAAQNLGVAVLDDDNRVVRLVEKPKEFVSDLALVGIYMFDQHIFDAIELIRPSARGELEITDAMQKLIELGHEVRPHLLTGWWIDTGKMSDMLEANRLILETMSTRIEGEVQGTSRLEGRVVLERGAQIINSTIRGPAIIGANARIENSYVGPFTAIDHDCVLCNAEIENSIVLDSSKIIDVDKRISDSLIGRFVEITQAPNQPAAYRLMLGDHSQVGVL